MKISQFFKIGIITFLVMLAAACSTPENSNRQIIENDGGSKSKRYDNTMQMDELEADSYLVDVDDDPISNTEGYDELIENAFISTAEETVSTFSIDVDNASYSNVRRFLINEEMPPEDAVRIEEMINYFDYDYPNPTGHKPFSVITEISDAPWSTKHKLIHIGIQGKKLDYSDFKPSNFVFLIDVSGSMSDANKLPLLKESFKMLVNGLNENDRVSLVVYAGAAGVVLPSTPANNTDVIFKAFDQLTAGGSTAGGQGITLAYQIAQENLAQGGNNRVILATDGDFNVGQSTNEELVDMITEFRQKYDIYLTICGFGMGNYQDGKMEQISNAGNGNYFYIDSKKEAEKVFVKDLRANMFTIAKDVKIQVEFDPNYVSEYRLIGYENRIMANEDFADDTKDAGELGAGHTVTAIYEIILTNPQATSGNVMLLKLRYKPLNSNNSLLIKQDVNLSESVSLNNSSKNFRFSAAVAGFGMLLRNSNYIENFTYEDIEELAKSAYNRNDEYQTEFISLVNIAKQLSKN